MDAHQEIHRILKENRMIAHIWCIEDVAHVHPDLTANQCWEVLQLVKYNMNAEYGVNWETFEVAAESLFGPVKAE